MPNKKNLVEIVTIYEGRYDRLRDFGGVSGGSTGYFLSHEKASNSLEEIKGGERFNYNVKSLKVLRINNNYYDEFSEWPLKKISDLKNSADKQIALKISKNKIIVTENSPLTLKKISGLKNSVGNEIALKINKDKIITVYNKPLEIEDIK